MRRLGVVWAVGVVFAAPVSVAVIAAQGASAAAHSSCSDSWKARGGGQWSTSADWSRGSPPTTTEAACITVPLSAPVVLNGKAQAASLTLGGMTGPDELLLNGGTLSLGSVSSITRTGELASAGYSSIVSVAPGAVLTNDGTVTAASTLQFSGAVTNATDGTIAAEGASLSLDGNARLTNDGAIDVGPVSSSFSAGSAGTVYNRAGTVSNGGMFIVPIGATFIEGAGTTSGSPVQVGGVLRLAGSGSSDFQLLGSDSKGAQLVGNIARGQTLWVYGTSIAPTSASSSFTNFGTFIGSGYLELPPRATLTNEGTLDVGHGGGGSLGFALEGNLVNAPNGVIGQDFGGILMVANGTRLVNQGTLEMLFPESYGLAGVSESNAKRDITFRNTGTMYLGVGGDAAWGGFADASQIGGTTGDTVDIGGTVVPVPTDEPSPGAAGGKQITYGITGGRFLGTSPVWALSCPAKVTEGWALTCGNTATLVEPKATTLVPTKISVTGSGTPEGNSGWETTYGQPVTLSATVSAQDGSAPTGTVAFFGSVGLPAGANPAIHPDLLGTATLSRNNGVASASLTTSHLVPGQYQLLVLYYGDPHHLAASTQYGVPGGPTFGVQTVVQPKTTISLASRNASTNGTPLTLTAKMVPAGLGPVQPTGVVTFFDGNTPIGTAPVAMKHGAATARLTITPQAVGSNSFTVAYSGDYNYAGQTSSPLS
jgi:Bacterial Ig-like domain (group 3)